jgi:hypothetical protein
VEWFSPRDNSPAYEIAFSHWAQTRADWEVNAPGCGREADYREKMADAYLDNPVGRRIKLRTGRRPSGMKRKDLPTPMTSGPC